MRLLVRLALVVPGAATTVEPLSDTQVIDVSDYAVPVDANIQVLDYNLNVFVLSDVVAHSSISSIIVRSHIPPRGPPPPFPHV